MIQRLREKLEPVNIAERGLDPDQLDDDRSLVIPLEHLVVTDDPLEGDAVRQELNDPYREFGIGKT